MDTELLKTFLAVEKTRHFGRAADNLYLTPAAVSARVRQLEGMLGSPLFTRDRNNMALTPAGEQLKPYAQAILEIWHRAVQESPAAGVARQQLALGGTPNLWDFLLQDQLHRLHAALPDVALRAECHSTEFLTGQLQARQLDIAVLFDPLKLDGMVRERLSKIAMAMISSRGPIGLDAAMENHYIQVDWGIDFAIQHQKIAGSLVRPTLSTSTGRIALDFVLRHGGSLYLPDSLAQSYLDTGRFHRVEGAPIIEQSIYMTYREDKAGSPLFLAVKDLLSDSQPAAAPILLP